MKQDSNQQPPSLKREEIKLLELIRSVEYGEMTIIVRKGKPVMAKQILKDIKLDD